MRSYRMRRFLQNAVILLFAAVFLGVLASVPLLRPRTKLAAPSPFSAEQLLPPEGVAVQLESATPDRIQLRIVNSSEYHLYTSGDFLIEMQKDGVWYSLQYEDGSYNAANFPLSIHEAYPGETIALELFTGGHYVCTKKGTYRLLKPTQVSRLPHTGFSGPQPEHYVATVHLCCEFTID